MSGTADIVYRVNDQDEIVHVNEEWTRFAVANQGADLLPAQVLHRPLWDFVADPTTHQLYLDMLSRVRKGRRVCFTLRCDAPDCRRWLEMCLSLHPDGLVEFRSHTLATETRAPEPLLDPATERSEEFVRMCGWCKRVALASAWVEVEEAIARLHLFEAQRLPSLTHGICQQCQAEVLRAMANSE